MKELSQKLKLQFEKEDDSLYLGYFWGDNLAM